MTGQNELKQALGAKDSLGSSSSGPTVCVYGYGQSKSPFYKEAKALKANSNGCLLILGAAVNRGQETAAHERAAKCNGSGDRQYTLGECSVVRS